MYKQLTLLDNIVADPIQKQSERSGSFVDNMTLPIHRWFRYSAGFSAMWVKEVLETWGLNQDNIVLDPFVGSGTVPLVCDTLGLTSIGIEAHPVVARVCKAKLHWQTDPNKVGDFAKQVINLSTELDPDISKYPPLIIRSFGKESLFTLDRLRSAWLAIQNNSPESELVWLALTSALRLSSTAGTAQWQYILPNKTKNQVLDPNVAFLQQIVMIKSDIWKMQSIANQSKANIILGDARAFGNDFSEKIDAVITSPPYANNYDYADALRFEMSFWGDVNSWGDLHDKVRKYLIVSSSQHASREKLKMEDILPLEVLRPIRHELEPVMAQLATERESHGGKKHYHTMIGAYFRDIGTSLHQLRKVCKNGVQMCWVIGNSAPYGVYVPVEEWIAKLAIAAGFQDYSFEKIRDRNIKWKNRKHRVPLKEGFLWIKG